ncbi:MAG: histidine kinase [Burkholderiaceae bacterium]|nr:histidine kinase [Burkholderiaceae bacterium]
MSLQQDAAADSRLEADWVDQAVQTGQRPRPRPPVDIARGLLAFGLLGVVVLVLWLRWLAAEPHLPLRLQAVPGASLPLLVGRTHGPGPVPAALTAQLGKPLQAIVPADGQALAASPGWLAHASRWVIGDGPRQQLREQQQQLARAVRAPELTLQLADGGSVALRPQPRGLAGLGAATWALTAVALVLYLVVVTVLVSRPGLPSALYAVAALPQGLNLLLIGAELLPGLGLPAGLAARDLELRWTADLVTGAALLHVLAVHPLRVGFAPWVAAVAWGTALVLAGLAWLAPPAGLWWWVTALMLADGLAASAVLRWAQRRAQQHPLATLMQRLTLAGTATLALLTLALAAADGDGLAATGVAEVGPVVWVVFFAALLMLVPFLSRSRQVQREFALLAGIASVAASLNLLFAALLPVGPLAALALALLVALGLYRLARHWIVQQLAGSGAFSAERMFDSLYRVARELEKSPQAAGDQLTLLLREMFEPLEVARSPRRLSRVRVAGDGSTLVVPLPVLDDSTQPGATPPAATLVLRYARRGHRLFTDEDVQRTERVIDQLRRAVAWDRAVEHGRAEERARIAQDLHDDIGARLLTLMYKAPNAEIEEYIRHTLQDLKTLTRGLAASNHRLSHAAAEWKADLGQRLSVTGCDLQWSFSSDRDITLNVTQWSGLTRVLRELVNNIVAHAMATRVEIAAHLDRGRLTLSVSDDGIGRDPAAWSHGLGLGGVRKRVKLLGGQVRWLERDDGPGIRCEVQISLREERP